ncbi:MAG: carotenoid biosynthesis protein [Promethearchaeota archaeon]
MKKKFLHEKAGKKMNDLSPTNNAIPGEIKQLNGLKSAIKHASKDEKEITAWLFSIFSIITIITTIIHFCYPSIFQVPPTQGPRLSAHLSPLFSNIFILVWNLLVASLTMYHSLLKHGLGKTALFFFGSMIFAGIEENEWIMVSGRLLGHDTYFFTDSLLWFFEIPVYTTLGWYFLSYSSYEIMNVLLPRARRIYRTSFAGVLAMLLDFFADPVLVNAGLVGTPPTGSGYWVWENENTLRLFSIPIMNFIGWWLLVFLFLMLFEYTVEQIDSRKKDFKKASKRFFLGFILLWVIIYTILNVLDAIFQQYFAGVNIFPIDFLSL